MSETNFLITSMHLNNELLSRIDDQTFSEHHANVLSDQIASIEKAKSDFIQSLDLYTHRAARERDAAVKPMYDTCISASKAVQQYSKTREEAERETFFEQRELFLELLRQFDRQK